MDLCACGCGMPAAMPYARYLLGGLWRDECVYALVSDFRAVTLMTRGERAVLRSVFDVARLPMLARACGDVGLPFDAGERDGR